MPTFYKKNSIFCRWNKSTCDFIPHLFVSIFLRFDRCSLTSPLVAKANQFTNLQTHSSWPWRNLSVQEEGFPVWTSLLLFTVCQLVASQPSRRWVLWKWKYSKEHRQYHRQEMDLELLKGHWNNWAGIIVVYLDKLCSECESYRSPMMMGFRSAKSEI